MKKILKSTGAIIIGLIAGASLSILSDYIMAAAGLMNMERFKDTPSHIVLIVILYRFLFNTAGCYLTAKLSPFKPMLHALAVGVIGLLLSLIGMVFMWEQATPFYNIAIMLISLPSAWIGGKLYVINNRA